MTPTPRPCSECGAPLPADAPRGACPRCLLLRGFESLPPDEPADPRATVHLVLPEEPDGVLPFSEMGDYELLKEIGRGGMGVIYQARQKSLGRIVALKLIRAGALARDDGLARFKIEAAATARLRHPGIVAVHEVGEHAGQPYYSMDFVPGRSLAAALRDGPFAPRRAAEGVRAVAEAIHCAHEGGVIHRDLKPSNILLDAEDEPRVSDFGLAKIVESMDELRVESGPALDSGASLNPQLKPLSTPLTLTGAVLGTPNYMPPEQARGCHADISARSDVYSLGAILYECLTARPPFTAATALETIKLVVEQEPIGPRRLNPALPRDLETICLKCLQKDPAQRYASARALAEDLTRWLGNEPIHARPSSVWEHGLKWAKRRPAWAAFAGLALVAPAVIIAVLWITSSRVTRERNLAVDAQQRATGALARVEVEAQRATNALAQSAVDARRADAAAAETRQNLYAANMLLAQHALDDGNLALARRLVEAYRPQAMTNDEFRMTNGPASPSTRSSRGNEAQTSRNQSLLTSAATSDDPRGFEWRYLWQRCQGDQRHVLYGHSNAVSAVAFSRDGKTVASGDNQGVVKLWDVATRRPLATLVTGQPSLLRVCLSADGQILAAADTDGRVNLWNLATRAVVWTHLGRYSQGVELSSSGTRIGFTVARPNVRPTNAVARVIDWTTGKELLRVAPYADFESFSGDGKLAFFTRGRPARSEIWEVETGRMVRTIPNYTPRLYASQSGRFLAGLEGSFDESDEIVLFDLAEEEPSARLRVANRSLIRLAFSPDSAVLAGAGADQVVRLWDVTTQRETGRLLGHVNKVTDLAFSPDGQLLATSSADQTVMLWPIAAEKRSEALTNAWFPLVLSPDGTKLASLDHSEGARRILLWDLAAHQSIFLSPPGELWMPAFFSADSQTLFARGVLTPEGHLPLRRWNLRSLTPSGTTLLPLGNTNIVQRSVATPDGQIYTVAQQGVIDVSLWNPFTGEKVMEFRSQRIGWMGAPMQFSADGRLLALHGWPNGVRLIDLDAPEKSLAIFLPVSLIHQLVFSRDRKTLAAACDDHSIRLLDAMTLKEMAMLSGHQEVVARIAFSPDGRTLASCSNDGTVKLWCLPVRREVATVFRGAADFHHVAFTPDGNTLLAGDVNGLVHLFRAPTLAEIDAKP